MVNKTGFKETPNAIRTTSRDDVKKKDKVRKIENIAIESLVDLPKEPASRKSIKKKQAANSSEASSLYSREPGSDPLSTRRIRYEKVPVPTPQGSVLEESYKAHASVKRDFYRDLRRFKHGKLDAEQQVEFIATRAKFHSTLHQMEYCLQVPEVPHDYFLPLCPEGKGIEFFSPNDRLSDRKRNFEPLNTYLNEIIGVLGGQDNVKTNAAKMALLAGLDKKEKEKFVANWTDDVNADLDETLSQRQKRLKDLRVFESMLNAFTRQLDGLEKETVWSNIFKKIRTMCAGKEDSLPGKISETIRFHYAPYYLHPHMVEVGREIPLCIQRYNPTESVMRDKISAALNTAFHNAKMPDQLDEWMRVVLGGKVTFKWYVDDELVDELEPFSINEGEDLRTKKNAYVIACQEFVGKALFNDADLMVKVCAVVNVLAMAKNPPKKKEEDEFDVQKRIMDHFNALKGNKKRRTDFLHEVMTIINEWNKNGRPSDTGEAQETNRSFPQDFTYAKADQLFEMLMMFYVAPYQKFVIGPITTLVNILKKLYPELDTTKIIKALGDKDDPANKIVIKITEHEVHVIYDTRTDIGSSGIDETYTLKQKMTIKIPKGKTKLDDPVKIKFTYTVPEGLKDQDKLLLDNSVAKIDFALKATDYEPMVRYVPMPAKSK
ncbi:MAG: hypothetical protein ACK5MA_06345 [Parachlamydiaceae bacterium]